MLSIFIINKTRKMESFNFITEKKRTISFSIIISFQQQKQNVISLQKRLQEAKTEYSSALKNLERISEELHEKRKLKALLQYPREPGVGAESETSKCLSISEMNLGNFSSIF